MAAAPLTYSGAGFVIPDNNLAGASSSITITDPGTVDSLTVTLLGLTHTWIGDLDATLSYSGGLRQRLPR